MRGYVELGYIKLHLYYEDISVSITFLSGFRLDGAPCQLVQFVFDFVAIK